MKNQILILGLILTGVSALAANGYSDEIICEKVSPAGNADDGLTVIVQAHPTWWTKSVSIIENGFGGPREIASFQIPLQPKTSFDIKNGWTQTYQTQNFQLTMKVTSTRLGYELSGPAFVQMTLPNYGPFRDQFVCKKVK